MSAPRTAVEPQPALVFTNGLLGTTFAKTCHGLLRGTERFRVLAVIDAEHGGADAGVVLDGRPLGIPVYPSLAAFFAHAPGELPHCFVLGVAFPGGYLPTSARGEVANAIRRGLTVVSGLHHLLGDDPEFSALAQAHHAELIDIRRPRPTADLHFWDGSIYQVRAPRVAVLGIDCAVGKRTTCRMLLTACQQAGIRTEMIYTGQTGWMQGYAHGLILDATPNDFVSGELERAIVTCARASAPELILIEGQSALRNASGPCGSEILLSAAVAGVILQHVPGRQFFLEQEELGRRLPKIEDEIALIRAYGVATLAVTLNGEGLSAAELSWEQARLEQTLGLPVLRPLEEGVAGLVPRLRQLILAQDPVV